MGECDEVGRVLIGLGVLGVTMIWLGVAVAWSAAVRVLRASRLFVGAAHRSAGTWIELERRAVERHALRLNLTREETSPDGERSAVLPPDV